MVNKKRVSIITLLILSFNLLSGCTIKSANSNNAVNSYSDSVDINDLLDAISVTDKDSWVIKTIPAHGSNVDCGSNIIVTFNQEMDITTLNYSNICIYEYKHSSIITDMFNFSYTLDSKVLYIDFKIKGNGYGTGNSVIVFLKGTVKNARGKAMGKDLYFAFYT